MLKADNIKLFYIFSISLIFYLVGCTDTSVQNLPTSIDFHSQIQIANLATVTGPVSVDVIDANGINDASTGTLSIGDAYPADGQSFLDIPSGSKSLVLKYGTTTDTQKLTIDTQRKIRLFVLKS